MSLQLNQINIAGNLARDPEIRNVRGKSVASFSVATNRRWKDSAGKLCEEACFIDCEAWDKTADFIAEHLGSGAGVLVVGRLRQQTWDDKETGKKRSKHSIVVDRIHFTDPKAKTNSAAAEPAHEAVGTHAASAPHDDQPPF